MRKRRLIQIRNHFGRDAYAVALILNRVIDWRTALLEMKALLASAGARYMGFARFNARVPAMTPSVKVDRSRLATAKPKANTIPAE